MERKKLLNSHRELLKMKREKINEAVALIGKRQNEFTLILDMITKELGVPKEELGKWRLNETSEYIEKVEEKKSN